jgi:glycopeptide antibiotics resistance protein
MLEFISHFSGSFLAALAWWPLGAMLLTAVFILLRFLVKRRSTWVYLAVSYVFVLYVLGLLLFTLYPMPDDPTVFCQNYHLAPQLIPFNWVIDLATGPGRVTVLAQFILNVLFLIPLGVFMYMYIKQPLARALLIGLGVSLLVETAQITGVFGAYPCSYRLFDVDDLVANTLGVWAGYYIATQVGLRVVTKSLGAKAVKPTASSKLQAAFIDAFLIVVVAFTTQNIIYAINHVFPAEYYVLILLTWSIVLINLVPHWLNGRTIGGYLVGLPVKK